MEKDPFSHGLDMRCLGQFDFPSCFNQMWVAAKMGTCSTRTNKSVNYIFLNKKGRPRCYARSPTAQYRVHFGEYQASSAVLS